MGSSADQWQQIQQLFEQALTIPVDQRQDFLNKKDAPADITQEVSDMLSAYDGKPLEMESQLENFCQEAKAPKRLGPYKIIDTLGRGGMSVVYLATRDDNTFNLRVAIKTLDQIINTDAMRNRFRNEQRIHARLEHPHIARILDAGVTPENRPFLVMQYVDGISIVDYVNSHHCNTEQILKLLTQVCEAITFAHSQLILHRDIKPSNILVNDEGQAVLLDFGIAKLLNDNNDSTAHNLTREGDKLMTLTYASPEQIRGELLTTASDVFSLGVLFYELLAGQRPFSGNSDFELSNAILNNEAKPPTKSFSGQNIPRDLQAIALKAIEKIPKDRYSSVAAMADDVQCYLNHRIISARPPKLYKKFTKFWRRNPIAAPLGVFSLVGIITSLALALWQAHRTEQQRIIANGERDRAEQVADLLLDLFDSDPFADSESRRDDITLRDFLTSRAENMEAQLSDQPELQAQLFSLFANLYANLGQYDEAESLAIKALASMRTINGDNHLTVAKSINTLATIRQYQARYDDAEKLFREALAIRTAQLPENSPDLATSINNLSNLLYERGRDEDLSEIIALDKRSLKMREEQFGENSLQVAESLNGLASTIMMSDQPSDRLTAETLYRRALSIRQSQLGNDHANTGNTMSNLANLLHDMDQLEEAEQMFVQAIEVSERALGKDHPRLTAALFGLGQLYQQQSRWDEAVVIYGRSLLLNKKYLPPDHPFILSDLIALAEVNLNNKNIPQAIAWLIQAKSMNTDDTEAANKIVIIEKLIKHLEN